jgi:hypothetical protein
MGGYSSLLVEGLSQYRTPNPTCPDLSMPCPSLPFCRRAQTIFMAFVLGTLFLQQGKETVEDGTAFLGVIFVAITLV